MPPRSARQVLELEPFGILLLLAPVQRHAVEFQPP